MKLQKETKTHRPTLGTERLERTRQDAGYGCSRMTSSNMEPPHVVRDEQAASTSNKSALDKPANAEFATKKICGTLKTKQLVRVMGLNAGRTRLGWMPGDTPRKPRQKHGEVAGSDSSSSAPSSSSSSSTPSDEEHEDADGTIPEQMSALFDVLQTMGMSSIEATRSAMAMCPLKQIRGGGGQVYCFRILRKMKRRRCCNAQVHPCWSLAFEPWTSGPSSQTGSHGSLTRKQAGSFQGS